MLPYEHVNAATPREVTARVTKFTIQNIAGTDKNMYIREIHSS